MRRIWKDGRKAKPKNKPWWKANSIFKKIQRDKRRAVEKDAVRKGKENIPKIGKEYYL